MNRSLTLLFFLTLSTCSVFGASISAIEVASTDQQSSLFERIKNRLQPDEDDDKVLRINSVLGVSLAVTGLVLMALGLFTLGSWGLFLAGYVLNTAGGILSLINLIRLKRRKPAIFRVLGIIGVTAGGLGTSAVLIMISFLVLLILSLNEWLNSFG